MTRFKESKEAYQLPNIQNIPEVLPTEEQNDQSITKTEIEKQTEHIEKELVAEEKQESKQQNTKEEISKTKEVQKDETSDITPETTSNVPTPNTSIRFANSKQPQTKNRRKSISANQS